MPTQTDMERRFTYHAPDEATRALHDSMRDIERGFANIVNDLTGGETREKSLAITALEEAMFWVHAHIARNVGREPAAADPTEPATPPAAPATPSTQTPSDSTAPSTAPASRSTEPSSASTSPEAASTSSPSEPSEAQTAPSPSSDVAAPPPPVSAPIQGTPDAVATGDQVPAAGSTGAAAASTQTPPSQPPSSSPVPDAVQVPAEPSPTGSEPALETTAITTPPPE